MSRWFAEQVVDELEEYIGGEDGIWFLDQLSKAHIHASNGAIISAADDSRCVRYHVTGKTHRE